MDRPVPPIAVDVGPPRAITWRSVLLGFAGAILICALTPYNDYALNNTFLVGNNLPLGVVMITFILAVVVNGPLSRWAPAWALSSGEMTVAFSLMLVSCALPSSGLMRYFPPALVSPFWLARGNYENTQLLDSLKLPDWLLPSFAGSSAHDRSSDPIVTGYVGRWTDDSGFPYAAWLRPALTWGIFFFAMFGALMFMVTMVRQQWNENERLPFPLAQIQLALVQQPPPRRFFNDIIGRRSFWIACGVVAALHIWNGCARYWPKHFAEIWVWYDLDRVFSETPWVYMNYKVKNAAVFFTVVGVSYFLTTPVAFSLWFFFILDNLRRMILGSMTGDPYPHGWQDQSFGGTIAYALIILWIGRQHWRLILRQALRGHRDGEPRGRYLPYPVAFWGFVLCAAVMVAWMLAAGCTLLAAVVTVGLLLLLFLVITRIIAETGLVHGQLQVGLHKPWELAAEYGYTHALPLRSFYEVSTLNAINYDYREIVPVYASHGLRLADQTVYGDRDTLHDTPADRRTGRRMIGLMMLVLVVGYFVSFYSTLRTEYTYAATRDVSARVPINEWGVRDNPNFQIVGPTLQYKKGDHTVTHSPLGHVAAGAAITIGLALLRFQYTWWPLHPVGYLMVGTFPQAHLWLSILIGWLCKVLILKFGGSAMYQRAKAFFIGLIVGESVAAGFWLVMGIVLSSLGVPYRPINIMPG